MVHIGDSSTKLWHATFDGNQWTTDSLVQGVENKAAPAIIDFQQALHVVHIGKESNDIWQTTIA
jgi:hypothetical protein